jgi:protein-disulfide isomerase
LLGFGATLVLALLALGAEAAPSLAPKTEAEARDILTKKFEAQPRSIVEIRLDRITAYRRGSASAPVVILEFTDMGCPRCQAFYLSTFPLIESGLIKPGLVLYVSLNYYLSTPEFAKAAVAAGKAGKYWEMKDLLLTSSRMLDEKVYAEFAQDLKMDRGTFFAAYRSVEVAREVELEKSQGRELGVTITPTFIVGWRLPDGVFVGARISGAKPWTFFRDLVDQMING